LDYQNNYKGRSNVINNAAKSFFQRFFSKTFND